jgi:hypothetical protein
MSGFMLWPTWFELRVRLDFLVQQSPFMYMVDMVMSNDRGEPAVRSKWTGWIWEITGWSTRLQENYRLSIIILEGIYRIYSNLIKENRRMSTCNQLDLQTLGSQPIMPKISPNTGHERERELYRECTSQSFIQYKRLEIVCGWKVTLFGWFDTGGMVIGYITSSFGWASPFPRLLHCSVFMSTLAWELFLVGNSMWQNLVILVIVFFLACERIPSMNLGIMKVMQTWKFVILTGYCWFPMRRIWAYQLIHSFLVGRLNPCLQGTNVRVGMPQLTRMSFHAVVDKKIGQWKRRGKDGAQPNEDVI